MLTIVSHSQFYTRIATRLMANDVHIGFIVVCDVAATYTETGRSLFHFQLGRNFFAYCLWSNELSNFLRLEAELLLDQFGYSDWFSCNFFLN